MARTLADALREFDDARLIELLNARRDLTSPIPLGIAPLAARATQPGSVHRALGSLVLPELQLAEVFAAYAGSVSPEQLARAVSTSTEQIAPHVYRLATLGLVFTDESGRSLVPVRALAEALPHPAGLAPRLSSDPSPDDARTIVEDLPDSLREVAHSLAFAPARLTGSPTSSLAKQLSSARLITKVNGADGPRLLIPRTVHLALRDGIVHRTFAHAPTPGPEAAPERFEGARDAQAIEAALEASRIAHTISTWHADPPSVLKRGGIPCATRAASPPPQARATRRGRASSTPHGSAGSSATTAKPGRSRASTGNFPTLPPHAAGPTSARRTCAPATSARSPERASEKSASTASPKGSLAPAKLRALRSRQASEEKA